MSFNENLKQLRIDHHMTQDDLAKKLYVTRQTVSRWENGSRYPDLMMIKEISNVFDVSIDYLLKDDEFESYSEKSSLTENETIFSKIISALFLVTFVIAIIEIFVNSYYYSLTEVHTTINAISYFSRGIFIIIAGTALEGFLFVIKKKDTCFDAGFIGIMYFVYETLILYIQNSNHVTSGVLWLMLINILCGVSVGLYFFKRIEKLKYFIMTVGILLIGYKVITYIYTVSVLYNYSVTFNTTDVMTLTLISNLIHLLITLCCTSVLLIYTYILDKKRKLNQTLINK